MLQMAVFHSFSFCHIYGMQHTCLVTHSSVDGHLGCFLALAIVDSSGWVLGSGGGWACVHPWACAWATHPAGKLREPRPRVGSEESLLSDWQLRYYLLLFPCSVAQLCRTLCHPQDCSPPGSSVHGFPRQEYWSELSFPSPGDLSDPGIKLGSPALAKRFFTTEPPGKPSHIHKDPKFLLI